MIADGKRVYVCATHNTTNEWLAHKNEVDAVEASGKREGQSLAACESLGLGGAVAFRPTASADPSR